MPKERKIKTMNDNYMTEQQMEVILDDLNLTPPVAETHNIEMCKDPHCEKCSCKHPENHCHKEGVIKLLATSENCPDFRLRGAEFIIKDCKGNIVDKLCTDKCGKATSKPLRFGLYEIEQIKAPYGYKPIKDCIEVVLEERVLRVCVKNKKKERIIKGRFKINKIDSCCKNIRLGGAEFEVFNCKGEKVDCIKTEFGKLAYSKELPLGIYTIVETKAPNGYEKCAEPTTVKIDSPLHIKTVTVENKAVTVSRGFVSINAFDKRNPCCGLKGAEFKILAKCGKVIDEICTDEFGLATSRLLPFGEYDVINTKAPKGYKLLEEPICVKIECEDYIALYEAPFCREKKDNCCDCD